MKMFRHETNGQSIVTKINKQWTSKNLILFGTILISCGIIGDTNAANVQLTKPKSTQLVSSANFINFKNQLEPFHAKYIATLMNSTFLPFLKDCNESFDNVPENISYTDGLCITYYDMISSIYHLNEFETVESVRKILEKYEKISMTDLFCKNFPDVIKARLEKQPFAEATNIKNWLTPNDCVVSCLKKDNKIKSKWSIRDICKLISGGLSMAVNKSKIETEIPAPNETTAPKYNSSDNIVKTVYDSKSKIMVTNEPTIVNSSIKIQQKTVGIPQVKETFVEPVQTNEENKQPKELIATDDEDSDQNNDTKIESESRTYDIPENDATADEAENHSEDGQHDIPPEKNSNSIHSPLSANINEFREDNESSFFSYFMFLSFLIITFYVAYHNKSKMLALLIEGRRGRAHSSRGGNRRKSHSAEYRKLDSNLEEAIQSGESQTLSSQIIY